VKDFIFSIHKEGYKFIAISLAVSFIATSFSFGLGLFFLLITLYICYFFRDPKPSIPSGNDIIVSPAHGTVTMVQERSELPESLRDSSKDHYTKISIFLSVFDVHVNRNPVYGGVVKLNYIPGRFITATLDKSSDINERQEILLETADKHKVAVVQIAGLIARRIVCDLKQHDIVSMGENFGIIRFGSRVDIYVPSNYEVLIRKGQTMTGGETVVARIQSKKKNA